MKKPKTSKSTPKQLAACTTAKKRMRVRTHLEAGITRIRPRLSLLDEFETTM